MNDIINDLKKDHLSTWFYKYYEEVRYIKSKNKGEKKNIEIYIKGQKEPELYPGQTLAGVEIIINQRIKIKKLFFRYSDFGIVNIVYVKCLEGIRRDGGYIILSNEERLWVPRQIPWNAAYDRFKNLNEKKIFEKYDAITNFHFHEGSGIAGVCQNEQWGLISSLTGEQIVTPQYKEVHFLDSDLIRVKDINNDEYLIINKNGGTITDSYQNMGESYFNDLLRIQKNGLWGFYNIKNRKISIPIIYNSVRDFEQGFCLVLLKHYFIIDSEGRLIIDLEDYDLSFDTDKSLFQILAEKYPDKRTMLDIIKKDQIDNSEVDKYKNTLIDHSLRVFNYYPNLHYYKGIDLNEPCNNLRLTFKKIDNKILFGFTDKTDVSEEVRIRIPIIFEEASPFVNGISRVKMNGLYGIIYEQEIPPINDREPIENYAKKICKYIMPIGCFKQVGEKKIAPALKKDENGVDVCGVIDESGEPIFKFSDVYDWIFDYSEDDGLACVLKNEKFGFINDVGKVVILPVFDNCAPPPEFKDGVVNVRYKNKGFWIKKDGCYLNIPPEFSELLEKEKVFR